MYAIYYTPRWGRFSRMIEKIEASSERQAEIKFFLSPAGDNCYEILFIEKLY